MCLADFLWFFWISMVSGGDDIKLTELVVDFVVYRKLARWWDGRVKQGATETRGYSDITSVNGGIVECQRFEYAWV